MLQSLEQKISEACTKTADFLRPGHSTGRTTLPTALASLYEHGEACNIGIFLSIYNAASAARAATLARHPQKRSTLHALKTYRCETFLAKHMMLLPAKHVSSVRAHDSF